MTSDATALYDVAVVGGGPAGLAAATELKRLGVASVVVLERESEAGGIPRHCGHHAFGMREFRRLLRGPDYARRLVARARDAGVVIATRTTVTALKPGPSLEIATPEGLATLHARHVLIATGIREKSRAARMIGGTRPGGVIATGTLQGLVYLDRLKPFSRPVVLGTELVSFSALLTCRHAGIRPVAMIEPNARITAWRPTSLLPRALGVPLLLETALVEIHGGSRVEAVTVRGPSGSSRRIETDGVIVSGEFQPEAALVRDSHLKADRLSGGPELDQFLRLSDPDYFAAGNVLRPVETAGWCWDEGRAAARAMARSLLGDLPVPEAGIPLSLSGDALKYAVPQRVVPGAREGAARHLQLRVTRPVQGSLAIVADGHTLWSRRLSARPERRILLPLDLFRRGLAGRVEIALTEDA